ncbi:MAG: hypothetical protein NTY86_21120 [Deltaproteobacteria bacterium]|nr:hypothetical protein [Deltaproteobacteria bacterium]
MSLSSFARPALNPLWFVWIGERYANLDSGGHTGYDGQFTYYIARYGSAAIPNLDNPPYRLQRILFPVSVFLLSWGSSDLIPWMMIAANLIAVVLTTYFLAKWLSEQELSPWYALMYSLYVGTFMAYSRDLTEPLAFCLVALGIILWFRRMYTRASVALALALLTKEITLLFVFGILASALVQKNLKLAIRSLIPILPLAVWQSYLFIKLGTFPMMAGPSLEYLPLNGIIPYLTFEPGRFSSWLFVGLPGLVLLCVSLLYLFRDKGRSSAIWWLLLHSIFVVLMPLGTYDHIMAAGRNASGLVLSVLFLLPAVKRPFRVLSLVYCIFLTLVWLTPILIMHG